MPPEETAEGTEADADEKDTTTMADVDHAPPNEDVNEVWARGGREADATDEVPGDD